MKRTIYLASIICCVSQIWFPQYSTMKSANKTESQIKFELKSFLSQLSALSIDSFLQNQQVIDKLK